MNCRLLFEWAATFGSCMQKSCEYDIFPMLSSSLVAISLTTLRISFLWLQQCFGEQMRQGSGFHDMYWRPSP